MNGRNKDNGHREMQHAPVPLDERLREQRVARHQEGRHQPRAAQRAPLDDRQVVPLRIGQGAPSEPVSSRACNHSIVTHSTASTT